MEKLATVVLLSWLDAFYLETACLSFKICSPSTWGAWRFSNRESLSKRRSSRGVAVLEYLLFDEVPFMYETRLVLSFSFPMI